MKTLRVISRYVLLAGMALVTNASAQKEQWLQYHISREGRGYRGLNLTTNPPPNITLPKFSSQLYFAQWTTPMDPKGRWVCFDRTRKAGPYDLAYIDSNGNGRFDDQTPAKAKRIDQVLCLL